MNMKYPHIAARLFNTPLLVHPQKLDAIIAGIGPRLLGGEFDLTAADRETGAVLPAEMFSTRRGKRGDAGYVVTDGVAVIYASGVLVHRSRRDADSSYLLGYNELALQAEDAMDNPNVHAVLQIYDSPGGEVSGAFEYSDRIHALRGKKPMYAIADSLAASAAYLGGSAFDQLAISQTGYAGSVGVVMRHVDLSAALEKEGVRVTHIYAGDHKIDGNPYEALPKSVRHDLQEEIDGIYALFISVVERNTGLTAKAIRATQAAVYRGQAAVDIGLARRVATTDQLISELAALRARSFPAGQAARANADDKGASMSGNTPPGGQETAKTITQADLDAARAEGRHEGATQERTRIQAILALSAHGETELIQTLAFDGKTSVGDAAQAVLAAQASRTSAAAEQHRMDAPPAAPGSAAASPAASSDGTDRSVGKRAAAAFNQMRGR